MMQIRTQKYAEIAYPLVANMKVNKEFKQTDPEKYKRQYELQNEYRTQALNLPTMILQSGLAQSIGFLMAKAKNDSSEAKAKTKAFQKLLEHLEKLLKDSVKPNKTLHETILESDIVQYQRLTRNAIEASSWLKRYTQALLEKDKKQEQNNATDA
ncbi:type III-B CRISPR module-associated protein Cmr5 [Alysiella filiformis]|nr:type III-B CRISPR module-associated protein Cmr5 [Alysiella filiformis]